MRQDGARADSARVGGEFAHGGYAALKFDGFCKHQNEARVRSGRCRGTSLVHMRHFAPLKGERLQRARRLGLQVVQRPRGPKAPR